MVMKLSFVTNTFSNVAQSAAVHIKNLCVNSKVDAVFRVTVSTAQTHPYLTIGLGLAAIYCCRGQIGGLINKVNRATQFLYIRMTESITNVVSILRRDSTSEQTSSTGANGSAPRSSSTGEIPFLGAS